MILCSRSTRSDGIELFLENTNRISRQKTKKTEVLGLIDLFFRGELGARGSRVIRSMHRNGMRSLNGAAGSAARRMQFGRAGGQSKQNPAIVCFWSERDACMSTVSTSDIWLVPLNNQFVSRCSSETLISPLGPNFFSNA